MSKQRFTLSVLLVVALLVPGVILAQPAGPQTAAVPSAPNGSILFVENAGQWPAAARFHAWGSPAGTGSTWLAEDAIWVVVAADDRMTGWQGDKVIEWQAEPMDAADSVVTLSPLTALKLTFLGSNPNVRIEPLDPLTTTVSYFLGNDPARWRPDVPVYGGVRYVDPVSYTHLTLPTNREV